MTTYIDNLKCDGCAYPMVICVQPRFTFNITNLSPKYMQAHLFADTADYDSPMWSSELYTYSTHGIFCNAQLENRTTYSYTISITDTHGITYTSQRARFETGFLLAPFPVAQFIGIDSINAPILYKTFTVNATPSCARLYVATLGFSQIYIDGTPVGKNNLSPVWSDYHKRDFTKLLYPINDSFSHSHYYKCYDVTNFVTAQTHTIAIWLGNGWYHQNRRNVEGVMDYGTPKVKFSLYYLVDGIEYSIHSDDQCCGDISPILSDNVYFGEEYDANLWRDDLLLRPLNHHPVQIYNDILSACRGQLCPDDGIISTIIPKVCFKSSDFTIYDVGTNISGCPVIETSAPKSTVITLTFAEEWDRDGNLCYNSTGGTEQIQTVIYNSNGETQQHYSPQFTVYGFRYIRVEGEISFISCNEIHSDVEKTGHIVTSSALINQFVSSYEHSQLSNLHSGVPSDCPHRERLGYTGDGWVTAHSACCLYDMEAFYHKWLQDICDSQCTVSGHVAHTAPFYGGGGGPGGWGGAIIFLPHILYNHYHNITLIERNYDKMVHWIEYLQSKCDDFIITREEQGGWCLGDWCVPGEIKLSAPFVNSCLFAWQLELMSEMAIIIGNPQDAEAYAALRGQVQNAIVRHFKKADQSWDCNEQGAFLFAWKAGIASNADIIAALKDYANEKNIDTGIFGTPLLFEALFKLGLADIAIDLLERENYPSFGWMFKHDATTLWESFDGAESHNHPMFGGAVGVLFDALLGLSSNNGLHLEFKPIIPKRLQSVDISTQTVWGTVGIKWEKCDDELTINVKVPAGMTYTLQEIIL